METQLIPYLQAKVKSFKGGQLSLYQHEWAKLTTDGSILQTISGECIEFLSEPPSQSAFPPNSIQRDHKSLVDNEILSLSLLSLKVIVPCAHEPSEFISPIFTYPNQMVVSDFS